MRTEDVTHFAGFPLFSGMAEPNFDALVEAAYLQTFPSGVELFREGEVAAFLFVVVDGHVGLCASWNGRETTMAFVEPTETFILAAAIKDAAYLMSARTTDRSRLLMIPSEDVRRAFARDEAFARAIVVELADCYRRAVRSQKDLKLKSGIERLAGYLLALKQQAGELTTTIALASDKRTLAALLGMTPENLSRAFATLRQYGVAVEGRVVTLSDLPSLTSLAKATPPIDDRSA